MILKVPFLLELWPFKHGPAFLGHPVGWQKFLGLHFMFLILSWSQWVVAWIFDTWEFDLQPGFCLSPRRIKNRVINSAWQNNREEKLGSRILKILWYSSKYSSSIYTMYNISNSLEMFESTKCHKKIFVKAIHNIIVGIKIDCFWSCNLQYLDLTPDNPII